MVLVFALAAACSSGGDDDASTERETTSTVDSADDIVLGEPLRAYEITYRVEERDGEDVTTHTATRLVERPFRSRFEPTSRSVGQFFVLAAVPTGFAHRGRYAVVPPQEAHPDDENSRGRVIAGVVDVWVRGSTCSCSTRAERSGGCRRTVRTRTAPPRTSSACSTAASPNPFRPRARMRFACCCRRAVT